ncbi:hypothetical protein TALK_04175 [Thalassospira alkalitolerans]|uniref:Uncharacterized protein n=1 Tax=Thalassospira alkalitolerans TaxID=1293890 RepID=A0A1Y2LHN2_9PROT|nr:hypothetical protein TALK_04175 [Thalassospira alkalitolerans]
MIKAAGWRHLCCLWHFKGHRACILYFGFIDIDQFVNTGLACETPQKLSSFPALCMAAMK